MKKLMLGLMMAFAANVARAEIVKTYDLGNGLTATLDDQGTLTIIGSGAMPEWTYISNQAWANERSQIKSVVGEGEIMIGGTAFCNCSNLASISLPNAIEIGRSAFSGCALTSISLPSATTIGEMAFYPCSNLASVSLPSATSIGASAFMMCSKLTSISLPSATSIGETAFRDCGFLISISLPSATTIGWRAFMDCSKLKRIFVFATMEKTLKSNRSFYGISEGCAIVPDTVVVEPRPGEHTTAKVYVDSVEITTDPIVVSLDATVDVVFTADDGYCFEDHSTVKTDTVQAVDNPTIVEGPETVEIPLMSEDVARRAAWEAETTITVVSAALKSGDTTLDKGEYESACEFYGITPKTEPTAEDFKAVDKDAQVVQEGEIAVKKESIAAPSAVTVKVEENKVQLGVAVLKTSDLTAEKKDWSKVKLTKEDIDVDADGNIIVNVPVDSQSGFMVIQTKDAKVGD